WLKTKPLELMTREVPSSFPSLHLTLLHVWSAEKVWLERLQQAPTEAFLFQVFQGTTEEIFEGMLKNSLNFDAYVKLQNEDFFLQICHFRFLNGNEDSRLRHQMILHCMNHSTYHRGQIVTIARNLGLTDPPSTDYMRFVRLSVGVV
ncbi:MAG TPA: DinB family protein, partial [Saprospiraceae bacterium]|nr:DinB family protein [Saprospiraceae bacterium]